jgi:hypothetical protein
MIDDKELKEMVAEIHKALVGDQYREEGLIKKVDRHDKKLIRHDSFIWAIIGAYLFLIFLITYGEKLVKLLS